jgi:sugar phosphate isomerase/epimerase
MNPQKNTITRRCFINAPWPKLKADYLDLFLEHGLQPEIGLEGTCLYDEDPAEFRRIADILQKNDLACTLHAPFFDLAPGALDPYILSASREKLRRAFDLLEIFRPLSIVCHLQFEENKQGYKLQEWTSAALNTWQTLLDTATRHKVPIMLENTYEKSPAAHQTILSRLNSPYAGFCLDVGHILAFAHSSWQQWLPTLSPWLGQLHLHDNNGESDQHLGLGRGIFDFSGLFTFLRTNNLHPIITLEPHSREDLWQALAYLEETGLLVDI